MKTTALQAPRAGGVPCAPLVPGVAGELPGVVSPRFAPRSTPRLGQTSFPHRPAGAPAPGVTRIGWGRGVGLRGSTTAPKRGNRSRHLSTRGGHLIRSPKRRLPLAALTSAVPAGALAWSLRPRPTGSSTPAECLEAYHQACRAGDAEHYRRCLGERPRPEVLQNYPGDAARAEALRRPTGADGADGVYLFDFLTAPEWDRAASEPPFKELKEVGDPRAIPIRQHGRRRSVGRRPGPRGHPGIPETS
jgi:hypothetical protein